MHREIGSTPLCVAASFYFLARSFYLHPCVRFFSSILKHKTATCDDEAFFYTSYLSDLMNVYVSESSHFICSRERLLFSEHINGLREQLIIFLRQRFHIWFAFSSNAELQFLNGREITCPSIVHFQFYCSVCKNWRNSFIAVLESRLPNPRPRWDHQNLVDQYLCSSRRRWVLDQQKDVSRPLLIKNNASSYRPVSVGPLMSCHTKKVFFQNTGNILPVCPVKVKTK